ncbi:MAG: tripartite tricarboxylate transporter substrate binding protein [Betaproteobacteria bacterium]|nr:tripartite tricarboxylate transporter substrate binding protein [Betaproteobacteria bacterium]
MTIRHCIEIWIAIVTGLSGSLAFAQPFPDRPVTIVVPYPPGASTDQLARLVQPRFAALLGQPVIIEHRAGAAGTIGAAYVAKSPADGYRILLATQPILAISPYLQKEMGFDPMKELTPLTNAVNAVLAVTVHPSVPANTLAELMDYGKKNPGVLTFGSAGNGSPQHIGAVMLAQRGQYQMTHIPYKGGAPMVTDLVAGHIRAGIVTYSTIKQFVADKKLRVVAIGEPRRFAGAPDIATLGETIAGFDLTTWLCFVAPAGLSSSLVSTLSMALVNALKSEEVSAKLLDLGLIVNAEGPDQLGKMMRADYETYGQIIRQYRIAAD